MLKMREISELVEDFHRICQELADPLLTEDPVGVSPEYVASIAARAGNAQSRLGELLAEVSRTRGEMKQRLITLQQRLKAAFSISLIEVIDDKEWRSLTLGEKRTMAERRAETRIRLEDTSQGPLPSPEEFFSSLQSAERSTKSFPFHMAVADAEKNVVAIDAILTQVKLKLGAVKAVSKSLDQQIQVLRIQADVVRTSIPRQREETPRPSEPRNRRPESSPEPFVSQASSIADGPTQEGRVSP
jgi:hypothetical protein